MSQRLTGHHVAVLLGGLSPEREVSLVSGAACADALERCGAKVTRIDAGRDLAQVLTALKPETQRQTVPRVIRKVQAQTPCRSDWLMSLRHDRQ